MDEQEQKLLEEQMELDRQQELIERRFEEQLQERASRNFGLSE